jgi:hypothetical protein
MTADKDVVDKILSSARRRNSTRLVALLLFAVAQSLHAEDRDGPAFLDSFRGLDKWAPAMVKLPPRGAEIRAI